MLKMALTTMGAEVVGEARNGAEAVALFSRTQPHITLLDVNMPVQTGDQALRAIRAEQPDAFVIMLTSVADNEPGDFLKKLTNSNRS